MAVFCGSKLSKKCTHLRAKGKEVICPGHKDCTAPSPQRPTMGMKSDWLRSASVSYKVMTVHIYFPISPVMEIVPLLLDHLKSKVLTFKTSKTCSTSLTPKENRQKYGQMRTVMSIRNHWYLILIYKWITQLPISACCMFMEPRPTYMCYIKRLNLSI